MHTHSLGGPPSDFAHIHTTPTFILYSALNCKSKNSSLTMRDQWEIQSLWRISIWLCLVTAARVVFTYGRRRHTDPHTHFISSSYIFTQVTQTSHMLGYSQNSRNAQQSRDVILFACVVMCGCKKWDALCESHHLYATNTTTTKKLQHINVICTTAMLI